MQTVCNGVRINYRLTGEGAPVTFIHGLTASHRVWRDQEAMLAATHKVLAYDLRGHGESEKPADNSFSFASHVQDLLELLDSQSIQQTALVGWSMGVSVAIAFAAAHPERVSRLVLIDGTPMLVAKPDFPYAMPPEQQAMLIGAAQQDFNGLMKTFGQMMMPEPHDPELDDWLRGMAHMTGPAVYVAIMQQAAPLDLRPEIGQVTAPTLVIHGDQDMICPLPAGQYIAEHIPGAAFRVIEGTGHAPFLTRAADVNAIISQFLA
ncbi:MAG: alpha/beta hydrolase fold protein [Symbiobacteriaceae bacterium]|jgi:pimeloyl-[acyl-carrier protein] methyl ester esterase|nr:alpha/beta hydrolase fold protein [Symbiobacteriaceae bacterium]